MNKDILIKTLTFLKEEPDLRGLTIDQIEQRFYTFEHLLISLVEDALQDKETEHGTLTTWWLYDNAEKKFVEYSPLYPDGKFYTHVESAEDFVTYMIERNGKT